MVIWDNAEIRRYWRKIADSGGRALMVMICAVSFSAGGALAAPYAQPGHALQSGHERAALPIIRAGLCGDDAEPCRTYEPSPYPARPLHTRRWEPEPEPYVHEERAVIHTKPDCVEERVAVRTEVVHEPPRVSRRSVETYDEPCGIRCWYKRLRAGYCGRGCDYYHFRMTQFPEGKLGTDRVRVACR